MLKNSHIHNNFMLFFMFIILGMVILLGFNYAQFIILGGYS